MTWTDSKLGRKQNLGVLHLGLFEESPGYWELFLYLRPGVTLGVTSGSVRPEDPTHQHVPRIAKIRFGGPFLLERREAENWSEHLAQQWIDDHLEALIAGERFSA